MDIVCINCKKTFKANPLELASASVNFNLGRNHTFKCDHCKAANPLTKAEFEAIKSGKPITPPAAPKPVAPAAPKPVASAAPKPVAPAAPKPVAPAAPKPVASAAPKPVVAAPPKPIQQAPISKPAAPQPRQGVVTVASLHVRKDHSTSSETVAGLVKGEKVQVLETWTDGKNTWAKLGDGRWAAVVHGGKTMIDLS